MLLIGNAIATIIRRMKAKQYFVARTSKILTVFCGVAFFGRVGVPHCQTPACNPLKSSRGEGQNGQKWHQICIRLLGRGRSHTLHSGDRQGRCKAKAAFKKPRPSLSSHKLLIEQIVATAHTAKETIEEQQLLSCLLKSIGFFSKPLQLLCPLAAHTHTAIV